MAKIPLRAYLKDVENLIERGEIEQAIAHAKNILRAYPKHIDTYRLLGKAFLESQRYSEAADILQRVLSVVPDDFVSQIGMSIIREDEGNLDAAIWHMERAYEVQPFNPAVQDELRRLYGKRDGVEPPKIRLTRGALVRMYARGELYPQAIAETRAALAEDAQRLDLRVLLARLYYQSGQKNDAAEVCSELISKLPYCYDANRLLTEILPTTSRAEETPKFQQRIFALDPYEAFISTSAPTSQQVPDQAVMVEQFLWEPGAESSAQPPEWTRTVGVAWEETEEEVLPDWLNTLTPGAPPPAQPAVPVGNPPVENEPLQAMHFPMDEATSQEDNQLAEGLSSDDLVPDWMKEAGWAAADRSAEEIMAEQGDMNDEELRPAEIPDWLQSMAPPETAQAAGEEEERTDWLENILEQPASDNGSDTLLAATPAVEMDAGSPEAEEDTQDLTEWMAGLDAALPGAEEKNQADLPDWLAQMGSEQSQDAAAETPVSYEDLSSDTAEQEPAAAADMPDWLQSLSTETETGQVDAAPDWLETLATATEDTTEGGPSDSVADNLPAADNLQTEEELLADGQLLPSDELSEEVERPVIDEFEAAEATNAPEATEEPSRMTAADSGMPPMPDMSDIEATMAWLEMLASRQGADEATLITPPDQRTETPPDWVQHLDTRSETEEVEQTGVSEETADAVASPVQQLENPEEMPLPDWLAEAEDLTPAVDVDREEVQLTAIESDEINQAVTLPTEAVQYQNLVDSGEIEEAVDAAPSPDAVLGEMPDLTDEAAAMAWLEGLAARQGADEATLTTPPEERTEKPPEWVLREMEGEEPTQPIQVMPAADLTAEEEAVEAELPDWLRQEEEEVETALEETVPLPVAETPQALTELETEEDEPVEAEQAEAAMPDLSDMDAAMAWLESLAARQGADEETLITAPENRTDTPPEWVQKMEAEEPVADGAQELRLEETQFADEPQQAEQPITSWLEEIEAPDVDSGLPFNVESDSQGWMESETPSGEEISFAAGEFTAEQPEADLEQPPLETPTAEAPEIDLESAVTPTEIESPAWLQDDEKPESVRQEEQAPEWLSSLADEETEETYQWSAETETASPISESLPDWLSPTQEDEQPAAEQVANIEPMPDWLAGLEEEAGLLSMEDASVPAPADYSTAWEPEISQEMVFEQPVEPPAAGVVEEKPVTLPALQAALNRGDLEPALEGYNRLIQEEQNLEEVIHDLRDAIYRYPVDIAIWQSLGDAYARNNQLQEALDAYTKAEELLR